MGSSAKKKKEKKKDFQKPKLKVGKTRPKNTNGTDTSFTAKSIVFKQQNLSDTARDSSAHFSHNLSLLSSKSNTQRRDALAHLTTACTNQKDLTLPPSAILSKAQPLILDGSYQVRQQLLKLLCNLSADQLGSLDQLLLYTRAGMAHLSTDIRLSSLDVLDWILETNATAMMSCAGGWVKTLRTFQNLLSWQDNSSAGTDGKWSATKSATNMTNSKLVVRQLTTLSRFLVAGLTRPSLDHEREQAAKRAAEIFPLWQTDAHMLPKKTNPFGYLNLFGAPRDVESEIYEGPAERVEVFCELNLHVVFASGVREAKKEGGEIGRAAALVATALKLVNIG